jgi:hypothetical protein
MWTCLRSQASFWYGRLLRPLYIRSSLSLIRHLLSIRSRRIYRIGECIYEEHNNRTWIISQGFSKIKHRRSASGNMCRFPDEKSCYCASLTTSIHTSMNDWTVGPRRINAKAKEIGQIVTRLIQPWSIWLGTYVTIKRRLRSGLTVKWTGVSRRHMKTCE